MLNFIKKNCIGILTYAALMSVEWLLADAAYQAGLAKGTTEGVKMATSAMRTGTAAIELATQVVSKNEDEYEDKEKSVRDN